MTEEIKLRIIGDMEEISSLLELYSSQTAEILTTDIDETLEDIIARREETTELVGAKRKDIDEACSECTEQEKQQVLKMITSGHVSLGVSKELKEIHKTALKMRSVFISAMEKEKQASARVEARFIELRSDLQNVSGERQKVSLYSTNNKIDSNKGGSFDSHL